MKCFNNEDGSMKKVRNRFSRSREVTVTRLNDDIYVHLNDIWNLSHQELLTKSKAFHKIGGGTDLRDTLADMVPHVQQVRAEMVCDLFNLSFAFCVCVCVCAFFFK